MPSRPTSSAPATGRRAKTSSRPPRESTMSIDVLKDRLPDYARDLKLNLSSLTSEQLLSPQQKAGCFIAAALAANHVPTTRDLVDAFAGDLSPEALNAAKTAARADGDEQHLLPLRAP